MVDPFRSSFDCPLSDVINRTVLKTEKAIRVTVGASGILLLPGKSQERRARSSEGVHDEIYLILRSFHWISTRYVVEESARVHCD